ncbi:MAG: hypothetical protein ACI9TV_001362 [Sulfurimonas sp.]|jgi:hypothetical protein|uniref:hypothetical protein n=1 Tax=Sulfurimonas sp. TaxID=2022749 RepID=UPI0039E4D550
MKKNKLTLAVLGLSVMLFSGCATILGGGTDQTISINSSKSMKGTMTYADGSGTQYFTTPATLNVERKSKDINITSSNGDFNPVNVKSELNPWFLGNIIFGGLIGSTTDSVGGAAWEYDETVNIASMEEVVPVAEDTNK